jgi:hypothetical protein
MKNIYKIGIVAITALVFANACKSKKKVATNDSKPKSVCESMKVSYTSDIKNIIDQNCGNSCHSGQKKAGGIELTNYESVKFEASKTRFMGALRHEMPFSPMPKKHPKLSDSTLQVINCWIENGSPL